MYANNNLYFVGNLVTEIYIFFQEEVLIYVWPVELSVSLANSPYFPLSSNIPFVQLPILYFESGKVTLSLVCFKFCFSHVTVSAPAFLANTLSIKFS